MGTMRPAGVPALVEAAINEEVLKRSISFPALLRRNAEFFNNIAMSGHG